MKYYKVFFILFTFVLSLQAQEIKYNIKDLYKSAYEKNPSYNQFEKYNEINSLKLSNIGSEYYPRITFMGQATYLSEVTKINIPIPNFQPEEINKDQYKAYVDIRQIIYDGGAIESRKISELTQVNIDKQKVEVELFSLKQKINDLYFAILISQERKKIYYNSIDELDARISEVESKIKNEIAIPNNLYVLEAQKIQFEQELDNIAIEIKASLNMLSELTGKKFDINTAFEIPDIGNITYDDNFSQRPEEKLYTYQKEQINSLINITDTRSIPKLSAFGQAGLGRPGLNMLDNTFQPYYTLGLSVSWNPFDWNVNDNDRKIYKINENIIELQRQTFEKNLKISLEKYKGEIEKYESLLNKDKELITLREKIVSTYSSQLTNGTITPTVYTTELNNKVQAEIQYKIHTLQLLQSRVNYLTTKGVF